MKLSPFNPDGSNHWKGVPSLNQGVKPPWRWVTMRFSGKSPTISPLGPAMTVGSVGMRALTGSWLVTLSSIGVPLLPTMIPPRYCWSPVAMVVITPEMGRAGKVGVHHFIKLLHPEVVN